ncbi:MAG: hypothetical protein SynsKO_13510 [Synoicihabitans sp.]
MNLARLRAQIDEAKWFESIGSAGSSVGRVVLQSIDDWDKGPEWDWLPSSNDQLDPFHIEDFSECPTKEEEEIFRETLKSLRSLPISVEGLVSGPHDFTQAARNAAAFATRMAAREIVLNYPAKWQTIVPLYRDGYWPCGRTKNNEVVVL